MHSKKRWQRNMWSWYGCILLKNSSASGTSTELIWHTAKSKSYHVFCVSKIGRITTFILSRGKTKDRFKLTYSSQHIPERPPWWAGRKSLEMKNLWALFGCSRSSIGFFLLFANTSCILIRHFALNTNIIRNVSTSISQRCYEELIPECCTVNTVV